MYGCFYMTSTKSGGGTTDELLSDCYATRQWAVEISWSIASFMHFMHRRPTVGGSWRRGNRVVHAPLTSHNPTAVKMSWAYDNNNNNNKGRFDSAFQQRALNVLYKQQKTIKLKYNLKYNIIYKKDKFISADEIATLAEDQCAWRNLVIACSAAKGWWWW